MPEESREEQSSGAAEKREPRAVQQRPPDEPQTGDRTAPRPFPERRSPQQQGAEERRMREEWKSYARLKFGVSPHAVAGALAHHDPAEEIGEAAVREALDEFSVRRGAE